MKHFNIKSKKASQYLSLFSVNILGIPIGLVVSIFITRYLGAQQFGDYNFINSVLRFSVVIANIGIFHAANRALVLCNNPKQNREYYGVTFIIIVILSIIMGLGLLLYTINDNNIQAKNLSNIFLYVIPFGGVYLLNTAYETLLHADNRIYLLSVLRIAPKILCLLSILIVYFFCKELTINKLLVTIYIYIWSELITYIYIAYKIKPIFSNFKKNISKLFSFYKSYGFDIYTGSIVAVGFASLTEILISYFSNDNSGVGYFTLAITFASPLGMIPATIATTNYKDFSIQKKIPSKIIITTTILSFMAMFVLWLIVPPVIRLFYGESMYPVIKINYFVSFGVILYGFADFFNRYLAAKGKGKLLRNSSIIIGIATLAINLLFIPTFGTMGAVYTKITTGFIYLSIMLFCYKKTINKN